MKLVDDNHAQVSMVPHQPTRTALDAYVAPESELCHALAGTPGAASDWSKYASFNLVTCATIPFSEGGHGVTDDNNCSQNIVRVVRTAATADDVGGSGGDETSSYELAESYSRDEGNSVVGVSADFSTYNLLDLSGAYHNTSADTAINGWLTVPISNAMVEGRAWVAIVGSGVTGNLDVFGYRLWDYDQTIPTYLRG